ncbi:MAG: hypothetical protein JRI68_08070, partial [Deltaproteobacteria bacterium]|nr:hypothetical protein [Deltaproteobacteria bacterium]
MFKELFSIFRSTQPIETASKDFAQMLALAQEMVLEASAAYWGAPQTPKQ